MRGRIRIAVLVMASGAGLAIAVALFAIGARAGAGGYDALCYWAVRLGDPYGAGYGKVNFAYSPPLVFAALPAHLVPFEVFRWLWLGVNAAALAWLGRRYALVALLCIPVVAELYNGNMELLLAVAAVVGFRHPAAWSLVLLSKVTPGVGLVWFAVRREWRSLALALGVTAAIALPTMLLAPQMWAQWFEFLGSSRVPSKSLPVPPLALRIVLAALLVAWGARTDRRWTVPVAMTLALPVLWYSGLSLAVGVLPLVELRDRPRPVVEDELDRQDVRRGRRVVVHA